MKKHTLLGLVLGVVGTLAATRAVTQITRSAPDGASSDLMAYQGRITDDQGRPVEGTHRLGFAIYDETGARVWGPQDFLDVPVNHGVFNLFLGGNAAPLPGFATDKTYELEITVDGNTLLQRQLIGTVPLAKTAERADSADRVRGQMFEVVNADRLYVVGVEGVGKDMPDMTITANFERDSRVFVHFQGTFGNDWVDFPHLYLYIFVDSTNVFQQTYPNIRKGVANAASDSAVVDVSAGTHTIKMQWLSSNENTWVEKRQLSILGLPR